MRAPLISVVVLPPQCIRITFHNSIKSLTSGFRNELMLSLGSVGPGINPINTVHLISFVSLCPW